MSEDLYIDDLEFNESDIIHIKKRFGGKLTDDQENIVKFREEVMMLIATKQFFLASEIIVDRLEKIYTFKSIRNDKDKELWVYVDGIYIPNGISIIDEFCRSTLTKLYNTEFVKQVVAKIVADSFVEQEDFFNRQNNYPLLLPVQNGVLNINTLELLPFSDKYYFFNKINATFDKNAKCPQIIQFIKSIVGSREDIYTIQEIIGFCLLREYKFEKGFMLYGEHGRNGKSKLLSLIQKLLGFENCANVSLHAIEKEPFSLINLHNKLVNISADISKEAINNTGFYKNLTGRDKINANRKQRSYVQFTNYAKMIFACNELPMVNSLSKAFWLRWVVIEFPYQFLPSHEIESMDNKINCFPQDTDILTKITSQEELNGLLNWALDGLKRLNQTNKFTNEKNSSEIMKYWLRKSNSVWAFIDDLIDRDYDSHMTKQDFRTHYHNYCKRLNLPQMSDVAIKITLQRELGISDNKITINDSRVWVWEGIKLKTPLLSDERDKILNYLDKPRKYSELKNNFEEKALNSSLGSLSNEGLIIEMPKSIWRKL